MQCAINKIALQTETGLGADASYRVRECSSQTFLTIEDNKISVSLARVL